MTEKAAIHDFVQDLLLRNEDRAPLADGDSLLVTGRLQSVDTVDIVVFLEERFGIDFAQIGFDRDQLDSVDAIYALTQNATAVR
ncbi:MAG TPA: hypothetical protein VHU89_15275 [Acidobacteriaceae bacterium]|jgi:acyl carrier protein|nr:hypothetical protein [Acidobacteriaceae bacterium]